MYPLTDSFGWLDAEGRATASFGFDPGSSAPTLVGLEVHHAYALLDLTDQPMHPSNSVRVTLLPQLGSIPG